MREWLVTCFCGWSRECGSQWAADSVAKLHPKLGDSDSDHVVRIEPPDQPLGQSELSLG